MNIRGVLIFRVVNNDMTIRFLIPGLPYISFYAADQSLSSIQGPELDVYQESIMHVFRNQDNNTCANYSRL